ncbi:MAG: endolytic transglycosylase MltG, partial [Oscillospiraceae bacterium]|nr:endolytic transglycosylase MltG [Oscillospiraceae bacterium]
HARAEELGMTMDEVITLASLIEKEGKAADFNKVSAVFHGRLQLGMALGSDVTIKYYTGSQKMALTNTELNTDSPYNTYLHQGLPPGPICNPSKAAIQAALYPDEAFLSEGYLYFCSTSPEEGTLVFNKTLAAHEAAVRQYQPLWLEYDRERGV